MKSSQKKLTVGIVGLGYWGPNWLRNILIHPNFDLAWIADTNDVTLGKFKNMQFEIKEIVEHSLKPNPLEIKFPLSSILKNNPVEPPVKLKLQLKLFLKFPNLILFSYKPELTPVS